MFSYEICEIYKNACFGKHLTTTSLTLRSSRPEVFYKIGVPWPTKYTAIYFTFEGEKLRGQFSENLVLWIYEFLFYSGYRILKKKLWKFWEFKIWNMIEILNLLIVFLVNTLLFVYIKQTIQTEVRKQPFLKVDFPKKKKSRVNSWKISHLLIFGNVVGCRLNSVTYILQGFC